MNSNTNVRTIRAASISIVTTIYWGFVGYCTFDWLLHGTRWAGIVSGIAFIAAGVVLCGVIAQDHLFQRRLAKVAHDVDELYDIEQDKF